MMIEEPPVENNFFSAPQNIKKNGGKMMLCRGREGGNTTTRKNVYPCNRVKIMILFFEKHLRGIFKLLKDKFFRYVHRGLCPFQTSADRPARSLLLLLIIILLPTNIKFQKYLGGLRFYANFQH